MAKYLKSEALLETAEATYVEYVGKNSTEADRTAFLEYLESEYITNQCRRLTEIAARKIGVFSLLDGMPTVAKGRPPSLNSVLEAQAYQNGNTDTYDYYLGERRTREEEQEFRQRLAFIRDVMDLPVHEDRAQAVAEYMLGPAQDGESSSSSASDASDEEDDEEEEEEDDEEEEEEDDEEEEEEDDEEEEEKDDGRRRSSHTHRHREAPPAPSSRKYRSSDPKKRSRSDRY